ncbi:hypothetical protein ABFS83_12G066400 [Erythranthe nasuta]
MICLFWNCQGLGVPLTIHVLGDILRRKNPSLLFLSETRATPNLIERLKKKWNMFGIAVDKVGRSGGLLLLWKKDLTVDLISFSKNHIDTEVMSPEWNQKCRFTGFYGFPEKHRRHLSWNLLRRLRDQRNLPWIVGGDFNEILCNSEKQGRIPKLPSLIEAFRETLDFCNLTDCGHMGSPFTWSNNRQAPHTIRSKLDRVCATSEWLELFPNARVTHLEYPGSDHIPILLESYDSNRFTGPYPPPFSL